jgi:hypothetical protein
MNRPSRSLFAAVVIGTALPVAAAAQSPPVGHPPPAGPPEYPPAGPGGYGGYGGYGAPSYPPAPGARYRPFTLGLGLGAGGLTFRDANGRTREAGLSYTVRIGFGVTQGWLVFIGAEGTGTNHTTYGVWQTAYVLGMQYFILQRLYLRAGFGLANATARDARGMAMGGTGAAFMAAAGVEIAQGDTTSLGLEPSITAARHGDETWSNFGLNFVLSFY